MAAHLKPTLAAAGVYFVCGLAQGFCVRSGYADPALVSLLLMAMIGSQAGFYVALRSGWSRRFRDPSLAMSQTLVALACLAFAYHVNPPVRGALLMIVALVQVFGAFTLAPADCRRTGWLAQVLFAGVIAYGIVFNPETFDPKAEAVTFAFVGVTLPLIGHLVGGLSENRRRLRAQKKELRAALERVNLIATRDELTGLPNRRDVIERYQRETARRQRAEPGELCLALLDLDHFKAVNDRCGHAVGDQVLQTFALEAQGVMRHTDVLARWGGEEFLLLLTNTTPALATAALVRLREHLRESPAWQQLPCGPVTFSAGLALHAGEPGLEALLARADTALYQAKHQGRDRFVMA